MHTQVLTNHFGTATVQIIMTAVAITVWAKNKHNPCVCQNAQKVNCFTSINGVNCWDSTSNNGTNHPRQTDGYCSSPEYPYIVCDVPTKWVIANNTVRASQYTPLLLRWELRCCMITMNLATANGHP